MVYVDPYVKNTVRKNQPEGRADFIRLDQNENQDGLPRWLFDEVMGEITPEVLAMYPEEGEVLAKYARTVGVGPECVSFTDGSVVAMGYLMHVFGRPGSNLVAVDPTFNMYHAYARMNGLNSVTVSYNEDLTLDVERILDAIDKDTGVVSLVNPNMPIGNPYSLEDIERIVTKAREFGAFVIIDEAYHFFCDVTAIPLVRKYDNIAVLRTFSKMFSIPGLRLGAIIASEEVIHYVNNWKPHYTVNSVTLRFAEKIADNYDMLLKELSDAFFSSKEFTVKSLNGHGYDVMPSSGCFLCVKLKRIGIDEAFDGLKERGILVFKGSGLLDGYVRLSISSNKDHMRKFVDALVEIDQRGCHVGRGSLAEEAPRGLQGGRFLSQGRDDSRSRDRERSEHGRGPHRRAHLGGIQAHPGVHIEGHRGVRRGERARDSGYGLHRRHRCNVRRGRLGGPPSQDGQGIRRGAAQGEDRGLHDREGDHSGRRLQADRRLRREEDPGGGVQVRQLRDR